MVRSEDSLKLSVLGIGQRLERCGVDSVLPLLDQVPHRLDSDKRLT